MKVTITGKSGTGATTLGKLLAEKLATSFDSMGDLFRDAAKERGMTLEAFERFARDNPDFDREMDARLTQFGREHDTFVVEARLGWFFIKDAIKVLVVCELTERLRRIAEKEGISEDAARQSIAEREPLLLRRMENLYGIQDIYSQHHFDIVVDSTETPPDVLAHKVLQQIDDMDSEKESL